MSYENLTKEEHNKAFGEGFMAFSVYDNQYEGDSRELTKARVWVDGWAAAIKEYGPTHIKEAP